MLKNSEIAAIKAEIESLNLAIDRAIKTRVHSPESEWMRIARKKLQEREETLAQDTENEAKLKRWFEDSDTWVGVFENMCIGHSGIGERVGMPFTMASFFNTKLGTRAPDTQRFIGWRHCLVARCITVQEATRWLRYEESEADKECQKNSDPGGPGKGPGVGLS